MPATGEGARAGRIAPELIAIAMWALAAFVAISLLYFDFQWSRYLGGAVGYALARQFDYLLGLQAYAVVILLVWIGWRCWFHEDITSTTSLWSLVREVVGGTLLVTALCAATGLMDFE